MSFGVLRLACSMYTYPSEVKKDLDKDSGRQPCATLTKPPLHKVPPPK